MAKEEMALRAGVDEDLGGKAYAQLIAAVKDGKLSEKEIDQACGRILRLKFEMGLFEHPYVDVKAAAEVGCADNAAVALDAARKLVTLLKNKDNTLPLRRDMRVAVVGPNADNVYNMLGDYTSHQKHRQEERDTLCSGSCRQKDTPCPSCRDGDT